MKLPTKSVLACLVHESPECIVDLVDNLTCLDPDSVVILYDGSATGGVLHGLRLDEREGVFVHPSPRPMGWGRLHDFAIDCLRFAGEHFDYEALTIVDSDQLAVRPGYSRYLSAFLAAHPRAGCLVSAPGVQPQTTRIGPPQAAWREFELWRPFLRRFAHGEQRFPHWTFWPATVFTRAAAADLLGVWEDAEFQTLMSRTGIWASEEVLLPTLVALCGHEVLQNPCSHDFVQYRAVYSLTMVDAALGRPDVFWIHPVPRRFDDPIRARVRAGFDQYLHAEPWHGGDPFAAVSRPLPLMLATIRSIEPIEGWLVPDEAELIGTAAYRALSELPAPHHIVEVGSYCGRATVVLGSVAKAHGPPARVYAIDPHDGRLGTRQRAVPGVPDSFGRLQRSIAEAGLGDVVTVVRARSGQVAWNAPISLLLVDHLHDFASATADFAHFQSWVVDGGLVAFHDYGDDFPGVVTLVDHLLRTGAYVPVQRAGTMVVLQKTRTLALPPIEPALAGLAALNGTLSEDEAVLLALAAAEAFAPPEAGSLVQLGSPDPRTDLVLPQPARALRPEDPIGMLVVAGLHEAGTAEQFRRVEPGVAPGGYVALRGYDDPAVRAAVSGLLRQSRYQWFGRVGSLVLLRRRPAAAPAAQTLPAGGTVPALPPLAPALVVARARPLVSCIMPTHDRRRFVPQAIRYFQRQDLQDAELIVVDDGADAVGDLVPDDPLIRYIRLPERRTIGVKRNIACQQARGELIVHWDDDDWMASWRLRYQIDSFLQADADVSGLRVLLFCQIPTGRCWRYEYPEGRQPWVADATFCYRRSFWESHPFADTSYGIDTGYLWQEPAKRLGVLADPSFYVALVHDRNTSRKDTADAWWHPCPTSEVASRMGADWAYYEEVLGAARPA